MVSRQVLLHSRQGESSQLSLPLTCLQGGVSHDGISLLHQLRQLLEELGSEGDIYFA